MRIAVATDGRDAALGALRISRALAERHTAPVEVITAVPPIPVPPSRVGAPINLPVAELDRARLDTARGRVHDQLTELGPLTAGWPIQLELGAPAPTLVRMARQSEASLIVLGLGRHAIADRWFGTETALQVARLAHVPVLAVPSDAHELPATAVVAVDFSEFSRRAAETVPALLQAGGTLHLTHVFWKPAEELPWVGGLEWIEAHRQRLREQLELDAKQVEQTTGITTEAHFLVGDAATETLRLADAVHAELIAAGSHGAGFFGRIVMGSVSSRLLRRATCMVLITPPRAVPVELDRPATHAEADSTTVVG